VEARPEAFLALIKAREGRIVGRQSGANSNLFFHITSPFHARGWAILISAFLAAIQVERGACLARNSDIPGSSAILEYVVLLCLIGRWLEADSRDTRTLRVWDMGFFLFVAWPVIVPYYLVKTRGAKRALLTLVLLAGAYVGAFVVGMTIFIFAH
jgi:hypothetical protein